MRLRRIAVTGVVLGLLGFVVRAEGRAVGRVLLGRSPAGMSSAPGAGSGRRSTHGGVDHVTPADGGRTPTLHTKIDSAAAADRQPVRGAGAGRMP